MADTFIDRKSGRFPCASSRAGQATIMVSVGLVFIMGILGLVMDVGWGYYRKQVAQAAADSAVLAAVTAAGTGTITCGSGTVLCPTSKPCTDSSITTGSNIKAGCLYGAQNGIAQSAL